MAHINTSCVDWNKVIGSLDVLQQLVEEQCDRMDEFINTRTDCQLNSKFSYKNTRGDVLEQTLGPILDHLVCADRGICCSTH